MEKMTTNKDGKVRHIILCGCGRSGTTLMNLIFKYAVKNTVAWDTLEIMATDPIVAETAANNPGKIIVTKNMRPELLEAAEQIRKSPMKTSFVYMWRDPAGVIASKFRPFKGYPTKADPKDTQGAQPFPIDAPYYIAAYRQMKKERNREDFMVVKFKDIVAHPDETQKRLENRLGIRFKCPMKDAWKEIPNIMKLEKGKRPRWYLREHKLLQDLTDTADTRAGDDKTVRSAHGKEDTIAKLEKSRQRRRSVIIHRTLGGVRPLDPKVLTKWKSDPEKVARVKEAFEKYPVLSEILREYGDPSK